jgi:hypothetical protein
MDASTLRTLPLACTEGSEARRGRCAGACILQGTEGSASDDQEPVRMDAATLRTLPLACTEGSEARRGRCAGACISAEPRETT